MYKQRYNREIVCNKEVYTQKEIQHQTHYKNTRPYEHHTSVPKYPIEYPTMGEELAHTSEETAAAEETVP